MPNYRLIYAYQEGRAETARMMFAVGGQEYEDVRQTREEWLKFKPETPYGEMPVLEVDGVMIAQSRAIERLLAKRFNLYGSTDMEQARIDMIIDCIVDFENKLVDIMLAEMDAKKEELRKQFREEKGVTSLKYIEKMISSGGYFLGDKISWADIALLNAEQYPPMMGVDMSIFDEVPKIKTLMDNVKKDPKIAEWIRTRPISQVPRY